MATYVIAKYRCEVDGSPTDFVDYQVRYFSTDTEAEAVERLKSAEPEAYENEEGQAVRWIFEHAEAAEEDPPLEDGEELIGFITEQPPVVEE